MKDITLSEFLSIIHSGNNDKIVKIENQYNIDIRSDINTWYGDEIKIYWLYKDYKKEKIIIPDNKQDIFARYNYLHNNPSKKTDYERNLLLDIIINNNWEKEYFTLYHDDFFGL